MQNRKELKALKEKSNILLKAWANTHLKAVLYI